MPFRLAQENGSNRKFSPFFGVFFFGWGGVHSMLQTRECYGRMCRMCTVELNYFIFSEVLGFPKLENVLWIR